MNELTNLLLEGGLAETLGWIVAVGMVVGVLVGNNDRFEVFKKAFMILVVYLIAQEVARYYYLRRININHSMITPIGFVVLIALAYILGLLIGRILLYYSEVYLKRKKKEIEELEEKCTNCV